MTYTEETSKEIQEGYKIPSQRKATLSWAAAVLAVVLAAPFALDYMTPAEDYPAPTANKVEYVAPKPTRWITPDNELPNSEYACVQLWKEFAGDYYITAVLVDNVSNPHYGELNEYSRQTGALVKTKLIGCAYKTSSYGNEIVMISNGVDVDSEGATRYIWGYTMDRALAIKMAGSYGAEAE